MSGGYTFADKKPHKMQKTAGDQTAAHARRKEERKNEKLNLSNYIVPFIF